MSSKCTQSFVSFPSTTGKLLSHVIYPSVRSLVYLRDHLYRLLLSDLYVVIAKFLNMREWGDGRALLCSDTRWPQSLCGRACYCTYGTFFLPLVLYWSLGNLVRDNLLGSAAKDTPNSICQLKPKFKVEQINWPTISSSTTTGETTSRDHVTDAVTPHRHKCKQTDGRQLQWT